MHGQSNGTLGVTFPAAETVTATLLVLRFRPTEGMVTYQECVPLYAIVTHINTNQAQ